MVTFVDFGAYLGRCLKSTMALKELKILSTQFVEGVFRDLFSDIHYRTYFYTYFEMLTLKCKLYFNNSYFMYLLK